MLRLQVFIVLRQGSCLVELCISEKNKREEISKFQLRNVENNFIKRTKIKTKSSCCKVKLLRPCSCSVKWRCTVHCANVAQMNMMGNVLRPFNAQRRFAVDFVAKPPSYTLWLHIAGKYISRRYSGRYFARDVV